MELSQALSSVTILRHFSIPSPNERVEFFAAEPAWGGGMRKLRSLRVTVHVSARLDAAKAAVDKVLQRPRAEWDEALSRASESFHWGVDEPQIERALDTCLKAHLAGSQTQ